MNSDRRLTVDQYLAREELAECRSEYYGANSSRWKGRLLNNRITLGIIRELDRLSLRELGWQMFAIGVQVLVQSAALYTYPDVMIACDRRRAAATAR